MIELERHIEILLLSNDCVIVPDLGGFVTHHREAHFDDEDNMFLPPLRTLGFNPQLNMNDSLLAQSYIEAYDISYPEAIRRIESEVAELKQYLNTEGSYELNDIGLLFVNEEGKLEFEPCEAGILTPAFYGLSSFEMIPLHGATTKLKSLHNISDENVSEDVDTNDEAITIRMSWLRNTVAVAAALLAFFVMTPHIDNSEQPGISMSQMTLPIVTKDTFAKPEKKLDALDIKSTIEKRDTTVIAPPAVEETKKPTVTASIQTTPKTPEVQPATVYCIVVASQVSQRNAEAFVEILQKKGIEDVRVCVHNNIRRVVLGAYATEAEAYQQLQHVHQHEALRDAWVYKLTN